jgi:hypothetical protein
LGLRICHGHRRPAVADRETFSRAWLRSPEKKIRAGQARESVQQARPGESGAGLPERALPPAWLLRGAWVWRDLSGVSG